MTDKVKKVINNQIKEEFYAAYLYLAMAGRLEIMNLKGMANWMYVQAKEEMDHAMGFQRFLLERGEEPKLAAIEEPKLAGIKSAADIFAAALKHEQKVTGLIGKIYEAAKADKDYAAESFVKWYIDEQVEEEDSATEALEKIKLAGSNGAALLMLDQEMAGRTYSTSGPYAKE